MAHLRGTTIDATKAERLRKRKETMRRQIQERADRATRVAQRQGVGWITPPPGIIVALFPNDVSEHKSHGTATSTTPMQVDFCAIPTFPSAMDLNCQTLNRIKEICHRLRDL